MDNKLDNGIPKDALSNVLLRNRFVTSNYRLAITVMLLAVLSAIISGAMGLYFATHRPNPVYFGITVDGRVIQIPGLNQPFLGDATVGQWALDTAKAVYTYDYVNQVEQSKQAQKFFTKEGWNEFLKAFLDSNTLDVVRAKRMVVSIVPTGAPFIAEQGVNAEGIYVWKILLPALVTYQTGSDRRDTRLKLNLTVVRMSLQDNPKGIGVSSFVAEDVGSPVAK